jgi:hypothetical protein
MVTVNEVNLAPTLPAQGNRTINELTSLSVTNTATDSDLPANTFTYLLVSSPTGASISTNGVITWTPTEAQGPGSYTITTIVTDSNPQAINEKQLSATNSFTVMVNEVNQAPTLPAQINRTINELATLSVTNSASDADIPSNPLSYQLVNAPTGATIGEDGVITWIPSEAQGPGTYTITTIVTDSSPQAANEQQLSATNSFTVTVSEVNLPPSLTDLASQTVHFGTLLSATAAASDSDLPPNKLTFSLEGAPSGMVIDSGSGAISWTPTEAQVGNYTVTVRVTDDGIPPMSGTKSFQVTVTGSGSRLEVTRLATGLVQLTITGDSGRDYELQKSSDLNAWEKVLQFPLSNTYQYIEPESQTVSRRFYRVMLVQ